MFEGKTDFPETKKTPNVRTYTKFCKRVGDSLHQEFLSQIYKTKTVQSQFSNFPIFCVVFSIFLSFYWHARNILEKYCLDLRKESHTEVKRNFSTNSDLSVEVKDEQCTSSRKTFEIMITLTGDVTDTFTNTFTKRLLKFVDHLH